MPDETQLEEAITALYRSPLEDFIPRRDALTKELRSAGDRAAATRVKALRKPSRAAWALNVAAADGGALRKLVDSVAATLDAQADGSDVRAAMTRLRTAVRELADSAAAAASDAGHSIDSATFATAVLAVLGRPDSFEELRAGRLVAVPEGGGLDFLSSLPTSLPQRASQTDAKAEVPADDTEDGTALRAVAEARERLEARRVALREAESKARAAEARVRQTEEAARAARSEYDLARELADAAAAQLKQAEQELAEAQAALRATGRRDYRTQSTRSGGAR